LRPFGEEEGDLEVACQYSRTLGRLVPMLSSRSGQESQLAAADQILLE
jgi:hypothetical protein